MSRPETFEQPDDELDDELAYGSAVDPEVDLAVRPSPHPWEVLRHHAHLVPSIAAGGAIGSLGRWGISQAAPHPDSGFAWATLGVNLTGSLLLGLVMALMLSIWSHTHHLRPFLGVGVLGGYTTFSTYELDTRGLVATGHPGEGFLYVGVTVACGLLAVLAGLGLGRAAVARFSARAPR